MINPITSYFEDFIAKMGNSFIVGAVGAVSYDSGVDRSTILMNCTSYMKDCSNIKINGNDVVVKDFAFNEYIVVNGDLTGSLPLLIEVAPPTYFYGEAKETNAEVARIKNYKLKVPMVYLNTPTTELFDTDVESPIDRVVDLRLFLLDEADFKNWKTRDHWDNTIKAMYFMADQLCDIVENDLFVTRLEKKEITGYAKIGNLVESDNLRNLFAEHLSGVGLRLSFPVYENEKCNLDC